MRYFKLYAIHKEHKVLITSYNASVATNINTTITYDEQLSESENDQYTLTFSMPRYLNFSAAKDRDTQDYVVTSQYNHWLDVVKLGSRIELEIDNSKVIDFIVSSVSPSLSRDNVVYTFTAQDELSYLWSRHNIGYSYPYRDEDDDGPQTIITFAERILRDNYLDSQWSIAQGSLNNEMTVHVKNDKFTFTIDDSNPYNALVEASNVLGYKFKVNYRTRIITFYLPDQNNFSGYRYRPETNLKSLSASYDAAELCTLMHAVGGTDANEQQIPLVPALPYAFQAWFSKNNSWATENWLNKDNPYTNVLEEIIGAENAAGHCTIDIESYKVNEAKPASTDGNINNEIVNYLYFVGSPVKDMAVEQLQSEVDECVQFATIADRIPYLGQFVYDFSFFDANHNGLMPESKQIQFKAILEKMRVNNTYLKLYTPKYYNLLYTIVKRNAEIEGLAEQYEGECRVIQDKLQNQDGTSQAPDIAINQQTLNEVQNKITKLFSSDYFNLFVEAYGRPTPASQKDFETVQYYDFSAGSLTSIIGKSLYTEWKEWVANLQNAETQYTKHYNNLQVLKAKSSKQTQTELEQITFDSEIAAEQEYVKTYETLKGSWDIVDKSGKVCLVVPGKWSLILGLMYKQLEALGINLNDKIGLATTIETYEKANEEQTTLLYASCGDFIYETTYENTDELDSVGLYNQTINNFALYNKPSASYSLSVVDMNCLEQIGIPNVTVGSRIKVYNDLLNLVDGNANNLQFTNNDLIITAISRKLRSLDDISLTVEKTNKINKLVEKLLINIKKE